MINAATISDIPELVGLVNSAYRGDSSRKGWTTEADLLDGELRTNSQSIGELIKRPGAVVLNYKLDNKIVGCVFLEKQGQRLYLGMLSVSPLIQAQGVGKKLLKASEDYGKQHRCRSIIMNVISLRHELISWYERHGYRKNGETKPFPCDDKFGIAKQPLEFLVLEKKLVDD